MTRSPWRDFIVGCFVLAGLGAIAYLSISVGGLSYGGPGGLTLYATFDQTGGLKPRAPVVIAGVKVGQVKKIALDQNARARVELEYLKPGEEISFTESAVILERLIGKLIHNTDSAPPAPAPAPKAE
jgi:phospholipid/cholesterol/gamma-HCH transport system substrate-binding protein